jgi:hypothetical protein
MTWGLKRQAFYIFIFIVFFLVLGVLIAYPRINQAPTCFDTKQNGNETGIDCGGSCQLACISELDKISVIWARAFRVIPGRYNAVAYVENKNNNTAVYKIKYRFRFADENNVYIGKREGETYIPPSGKFAVFEPAIGIGNSTPVFTTFEFTEEPVWVQVLQQEIDQSKVFISDINLVDEDTSPKLSAKIKNSSLFIIPEVSIIAILYDKAGNAVSASRTYLDILKAGERTDLSFTWLEPFTEKIVAKEMIPMYNIFLVKLK